MWRQVTDAVGIAGRDSLWDYPDLMPQSSDIDDPTALIARLQAMARGEAPAADEFDEALERLLAGDDFGAASDVDEATSGDDGSTEDGSTEDGSGSDRPEGDRPV